MLVGTRKIMGSEYEKFCSTMLMAAEEGALPIIIQMDNTFGITCQDIADLCNDFKKDTELDLSVNLFVCPDCGKLHAILEIDFEENDETDDMLLQ